MTPLETAAHTRGAARGEAQARHEDFAPAPNSWYYVGHMDEIGRKPLRFELPNGQAFVAFRTASGRLGVLAARCCHMNADLARGCVVGERIACPLHGWEYATDGRCERIPVSANIPAFARQKSFPVEEIGGHVFLFNQVEARFPLPFFDNLAPSDLLAAPRFEFTVEAPWYLVSANGFDLQHFRVAHDRTLCSEPVMDCPHPFARRLQASFRVTGHSALDRLTRTFSGDVVEMSVTNWCGNLVLVKARFARTTTYGMVSFVPLPSGRTLVRDLVWIPRRSSSLGRALVDPVDAWLRRFFIREFVRSDVDRSAGLRFERPRMIEADRALVAYIDWLCPIHR
jgi:phenylpropionate dioxygenase-like ring-hydroxylating dioxygenase large terminal subunit